MLKIRLPKSYQGYHQVTKKLPLKSININKVTKVTIYSDILL